MHQEVESLNPVKFLRLNTGEDIITELAYEKDTNHYKLTNPLRIVYKEDALVMAFTPWIYFSICDKQEFPIFPNDVITMADPNREIVGYYKEFIKRMEVAREDFKHGDYTILEKIEPRETSELSDAEEEYLREFLENMDSGNKRKLH